MFRWPTSGRDRSRGDLQARVETILYNPFPLSTKPLFQFHVLVTEPNKPQRYLIIGELASGAAAAVIEKNESLKPGKRFRLDDKKSGRVELVPRKSP